MPSEHGDLSAGRGVPHARGFVLGRRHHPCPVGREGCGIDPALMPLSTAISAPVAASHTRAVLSQDAVTTRVPSGEKAAELTPASCPLSTAISAPVAASHTRAVLSSGRRHHPCPVGREGCGIDRAPHAL